MKTNQTNSSEATNKASETILLNTNLLGISGAVCAYHGLMNPDGAISDEVYEIKSNDNLVAFTENDKNGITIIEPDDLYNTFDNDAYDKQITEALHDYVSFNMYNELKELGFDSIIAVNGGERYSPKEYNFSTDNNDIILEITSYKAFLQDCKKIFKPYAKGYLDRTLQEKYRNEQTSELIEFLRENYTSCDGFWSDTANNLPDLWQGIVNENEQEIGAFIRFLLIDLFDNSQDMNSLEYYMLETVSVYNCMNYQTIEKDNIPISHPIWDVICENVELVKEFAENKELEFDIDHPLYYEIYLDKESLTDLFLQFYKGIWIDQEKKHRDSSSVVEAIQDIKEDTYISLESEIYLLDTFLTC